MSKATALRLYILLLIFVTGCVLLAMPSQITVTFGKVWCSILPSQIRSHCTSLSFLPEKKEITLHRPDFGFTLGSEQVRISNNLRYGLDIQGGTQITLLADMTEINDEDRDTALESAKHVIERRIDLYGVSETSVVTSKVSNQYRLLASIPGASNAQEAIDLIGTTAQLDFRTYNPATPSAQATASGYLIKDFQQTGLTGRDLKKATVEFENQTGKPAVMLEFNDDGTKKFSKLTSENMNKPVGIFIDDYALSVPTVQNQITDGKASITGNFTLDQAKSLAVALNAGALPVPITVLSQQTVGPELGAKAIHQSVQAGFIGISLVMLFMLLIYGVKGVFSIISLLFYGVVTIALYKSIPVTLTLPGIAGFLLSMGMAVDTNILVFERLAEEEKKGHKSTISLLSKSFERAWDSIKDANITTLLIAFILANPFGWVFLNSSGMIRGFATTLAIGIFINLLAGMILTRVLMILFYKPVDE